VVRDEREPERVAMLPVAVERLELVVLRFEKRVEMFPVAVERLVKRVEMLPVAVARFVWRERILPVAVARLELVVARFEKRVEMFPVAVARLELVVARLEFIVMMLASWRVLDPWSFWNAWRIESVARTVPDDAENPVRREAMERALVK
jgi:hypothetical protein